jgi:hypothetical protein
MPLLLQIAHLTWLKMKKKVGNPFSKVGNFVISDSDSDSDDDEVLEDYNKTTSFMAFNGSKSGSGVGIKSLLEQ